MDNNSSQYTSLKQKFQQQAIADQQHREETAMRTWRQQVRFLRSDGLHILAATVEALFLPEDAIANAHAEALPIVQEV